MKTKEGGGGERGEWGITGMRVGVKSGAQISE